MITTMPAPFREPEDKALKWLIIFILLSLIAHVVIISAILLVTRYMPAPKLAPDKPKDSVVTLTLVPPAPPPPAPKIFIPTQPQQNTPHTQQPTESANDTVLQSRSTVVRQNSLMPDVNGSNHASNLNNSPLVKSTQAPQVSSTPPTPKHTPSPKPPVQTPKPQASPQVQPRPLPPQPKPAPPKPPQPQQQQVDPETGLPVLPPITAATMAPPDQAAKPLAPAPSQQQTAESIHGSLGRNGDNSPASMATELGKYKQYVYSVVGSYWYPAIDQHFGLIGVGVVHIQFTIHSDGTISDVTVLEGDNLDQLKTISKNALVAPAPFKPFSPAMIKEVGDSYTDDFSFSVY
jgi:outer membrane biosynthesis protein TonB